jgi:hypothetical protein
MHSKSEMRRMFSQMSIDQLREEVEKIWYNYQKASDENAIMRDALESVACPSRPELSTFDYWKGREHHKLVETCHNDTLVTREALSKLGQKSPDINCRQKVSSDDIFPQEKVQE